MIDSIVQEVRDARAAIAAEFDYDLGRYLDWIQEQQAKRKTNAGYEMETGPGAFKLAAQPLPQMAGEPALQLDSL